MDQWECGSASTCEDNVRLGHIAMPRYDLPENVAAEPVFADGSLLWNPSRLAGQRCWNATAARVLGLGALWASCPISKCGARLPAYMSMHRGSAAIEVLLHVPASGQRKGEPWRPPASCCLPGRG